MFLTRALFAVLAVAAAAPAARVEISAAASLVAEGHEVEVLSGQSGEAVRLTAGQPRGTVSPPGPVFALRRDRRGTLAGVVLPRRYPAGRARLVSLDAPLAGRRHLVVRADFSKKAPGPPEGAGNLRILLTRPSEPVLPAVVGRDERGVVALFSNVPAGDYTLRIDGDRWRTAEGRVALDSEAPIREEVLPMRIKPSIHVDLDLDPSLAKKSRTVSLLECPGWDGAEDHAPGSDECHATSQKIAGDAADFRWLEPLPYFIEVSTDGHVKRIRADARGEEDVTLKSP